MVGKAMKSNAVAAPEKADRKIAKRDSEYKEGKSSKKQKLAPSKDSVLEKKISKATTSEENPGSKSEQDSKRKKHPEKSEEKEVKDIIGQKSCPNTLFIGNLSYDVSEDNIKEFFKHAGKIVDVRLAKDRRGRSKGLGHVEFADEEAAQKAMEKNKKVLMGREINLEFARQKGATDGRGTSWTVFVTGFDKLQDLNKLEKSLREYFRLCGAITRVSTPTDRESGGSKGIAYLDFKDQAAFSKALKLNKTKMGDCTLAVVKAKPKSDTQADSFGGRGSRGGGSHGGGGGGRGDVVWFDRPTKSQGKCIKFDQ